MSLPDPKSAEVKQSSLSHLKSEIILVILFVPLYRLHKEIFTIIGQIFNISMNINIMEKPHCRCCL